MNDYRCMPRSITVEMQTLPFAGAWQGRSAAEWMTGDTGAAASGKQNLPASLWPQQLHVLPNCSLKPLKSNSISASTRKSRILSYKSKPGPDGVPSVQCLGCGSWSPAPHVSTVHRGDELLIHAPLHPGCTAMVQVQDNRKTLLFKNREEERMQPLVRCSSEIHPGTGLISLIWAQSFVPVMIFCGL